MRKDWSYRLTSKTKKCENKNETKIKNWRPRWHYLV